MISLDDHSIGRDIGEGVKNLKKRIREWGQEKGHRFKFDKARAVSSVYLARFLPNNRSLVFRFSNHDPKKKRTNKYKLPEIPYPNYIKDFRVNSTKEVEETFRTIITIISKEITES